MSKVSQEEPLEPIQYKNIYHEDDVPLKSISNKTISNLVYFGIGFFLVLIILGSTIKIPNEVKLDFQLRGGLKEDVIQYNEDVFIEEKFVHEGQFVQVGDTLLKITSSKITEFIDDVRVAKNNLALYQKEISSVKKEEIALLLIERERLLQETNYLNQKLNRLEINRQNMLKDLKSAYDLGLKDYKRDSILHQKEILSDKAVEASLSAVIKLNQDIQEFKIPNTKQRNELSWSILQNQNQIAHVEQKIKFTESDNQHQLNKLREQLKVAQQRLKSNYGNNQIMNNSLLLMSNENAQVSLIAENESIKAKDYLLKLNTGSEDYYAYAEVSSENRGQLEIGKKAILKFESLPHYQYGVLEGEVSYLSLSNNRSGFFPLRIKTHDLGKLKKYVSKGLTGNAAIILEERTLFEFLFSKFADQIDI